MRDLDGGPFEAISAAARRRRATPCAVCGAAGAGERTELSPRAAACSRTHGHWPLGVDEPPLPTAPDHGD